MANEFIARKGLIALENSQITGSLSVTNSVTASFFTGSFIGDGSQLSGVSAGFPFTGSATISGSLQVTGSVSATAFIGDGSQLTGIADPTPITATINNTNSPFTVTSQSIVIIDSTNGDVTVNLPDLDLIDGTPDQKPILLYKNDYSQNVVYVQPSGSQLVNGTTQDIIVSIQIAIAYNPTSAGWVTEGTSYQSLAELELFFVPRTETGSFATTGSNQFSGSQTITGSLTVTGNITGNITGSASTASYVEYANVANKPALVSGSSQITYSGLTGIPSGIVSGSAQISDFGIFATTGSNQFNGNQTITGSLTVTGQVVAQTLNVQQVTSSIVFSSGSNIFGNSLANTQQFTGSVGVTGSLAVTGAGTFTTSITPLILKSTNATTMWTEYYYNTSTLSGYIGSGGGILSGANTSDFIIRSEADFVVATGGNNRRLTIASTGAATFNTTATTAVSAISTGTASGLQLTNSGGTASSWIIQSDGGAVAGQAALRFYSLTASAYRMSIDGSGNVGIGTTSPNLSAGAAGSTILTISATTSGRNGVLELNGTRTNSTDISGYVRFFNNSAATPLAEIRAIRGSSDTVGDLTIETSGAERMRITSGGSINFSGLDSTTQYYFGYNRPTATNLLVNGGNNNKIRIQNVESDVVVLNSNGNSYFNGGNVGIGTDSPFTKLEVLGGNNLPPSTGTQNYTIALRDPTSMVAGVGGSILLQGFKTSTSAIGNFAYIAGKKENGTAGNEAGFLSLGTFDSSGIPSEKMRINSSGDLIVKGTVANISLLGDGVQMHFSRNATNYIIANGGTGSTIRIISNTNGVELSNGATSWVAVSDENLKEMSEWKSFENSVQKILSLRAGTSRYKTDEEGISRSFLIAQDVQEVLPEAVSEYEDGTLGLRYTEVIPLLVSAIQEQQSQIEILKAEIQTLKQ